MTKPFDPTKPVQTRGGLYARIVCIDGKATYANVAQPIVAESQISQDVALGYTINTYGIDGRILPNYEDPRDLINIPEKKKLTGWVNVYPPASYSQSNIWPSKQEADCRATKDRLACIDISKYNIEFEEGEGL